MKLGDILTIPLTKVNWYYTTWVFTCIITLIPGLILWIVTLGGFRYFNVMTKFCAYLVDKDLHSNGN
jgi:hypothetical protein